MFFVQSILWGGSNNNCMTEVPLLYWWLTAQIIIFYIIVAVGLCTWGSYICKVADAAEELTKEAVDEYLKDRKKQEKHYMIKAGDSNAKLLQNGPGAPPPSTQRLMIQQQNKYEPIPHSDAAMIKANQPLLHAKTVQLEKEMRHQQLAHEEQMMVMQRQMTMQSQQMALMADNAQHQQQMLMAPPQMQQQPVMMQPQQQMMIQQQPMMQQ